MVSQESDEDSSSSSSEGEASSEDESLSAWMRPPTSPRQQKELPRVLIQSYGLKRFVEEPLLNLRRPSKPLRRDRMELLDDFKFPEVKSPSFLKESKESRQSVDDKPRPTTVLVLPQTAEHLPENLENSKANDD